ncbi:Ubiquinone biosynthesis O-methyltransferase [subsurface metagenome]
MGVKEFYEKMYQDDRPDKPKPSLYTSILEHTLGRFGVNRYELTYQVLPGGNSILDIGCGEDLTLMPLWNKYREVYGIDISKPRIERMQKRFGNNPSIHLSVQDVNNRLSFEDASFDTITAIAVLEHIFDPYHFMKECHRLLKLSLSYLAKILFRGSLLHTDDTHFLTPAIKILPSRSGLKMLHGLPSVAKTPPEVIFITLNPSPRNNLFKDALVK